MKSSADTSATNDILKYKIIDYTSLRSRKTQLREILLTQNSWNALCNKAPSLNNKAENLEANRAEAVALGWMLKTLEGEAKEYAQQFSRPKELMEKMFEIVEAGGRPGPDMLDGEKKRKHEEKPATVRAFLGFEDK
jgi:hypothetical protein